MKIRARDCWGEWEAECDGHPDHDKWCWCCVSKCEEFWRVKEEAQRRFDEAVKRLIEEYSKIGKVVEHGSANCYECPLKPGECPYCKNHPPFLHLQRPYVLVMIEGAL